MDTMLPTVVMSRLDADSEHLPNRMMHYAARAYRWSYKDGRGIRRVVGWSIGLIPYIALMWTLCFISLLWGVVIWLVVPKEEFKEHRPDNW